MVMFQSLFSEQRRNVIEHNGVTYHRYLSIPVKDTVILKFKVICIDSPYTQAVVISFPPAFDGTVSVDDRIIPIKKSSFPKANFWMDTAPSEFAVTIRDYEGDIIVCNGSDPLGTKQICKHLSAGCAMVIDCISPNKFICSCNDHVNDMDCDDLIFEVDILS